MTAAFKTTYMYINCLTFHRTYSIHYYKENNYIKGALYIMNINIIKCTLDDLSTLQEISYETFNETFNEHNSPENMNSYMERAFNLKQIERLEA